MLSTNTANSHTAKDGMRRRAGVTPAETWLTAIANTTMVRIPDACSASATIQIANALQNWTTTAIPTSWMRPMTRRITRDRTMPSRTLPTTVSNSAGTTRRADSAPAVAAPSARR